MFTRSIRASLMAGAVLIVLLSVIIAVNRFLIHRAGEAENSLMAISNIRTLFAKMELYEHRSLEEPAHFSYVESLFKKLKDGCLLYGGRGAGDLLDERNDLFSRLFSINNDSRSLHYRVGDSFAGLLDSVKYIHAHHLAYLKNLAARNALEKEFRIDEGFERSSGKSASEVDVLASAIAIKTSLFDIFSVFNSLDQVQPFSQVDNDFRQKIRKFYLSVNRFEDYSLDAQDGLLVEELLTMGREFENAFDKLLEMERQRLELESGLENNHDALHSLLESLSRKIIQGGEKDKRTIGMMQTTAILFASLLAFFSIVISFRVASEARKTVRETVRIRKDVSYQIPMKTNTFAEFSLIFKTLNSMAARINDQVSKLNDSKNELEARVQERTRELQLVNVSLTEEMMERREAQEALAESEERLKNIIDRVNVGIVIVDAQTRIIVNSNPTAERLLADGEGELEGGSWLDHSTGPQAEKLPGDNAGYEGRETVLVSQKGRRIDALLTAIPVQMDGKKQLLKSFIDIRRLKDAQAKKRDLENQLENSRKMEVIGSLAGGVAHDFNNILGAIIGYTELADYELARDSSAAPFLKEVLKAAERAKMIIRQILAFSRRNEPEQAPVQLGAVINEVMTLVRASFPSTISLQASLECDNDVVMADSNQLHQVLMNLLTNAQHAAPETGGVVEVALESVQVNREDQAALHPLEPGSYLKITVKDNGCGMDEATMQRIFDPYFTTKGKGKGTGMGLAVVDGIIRNHGGLITVDSRPGQGARFTVWLPAREGQALSGEEQLPEPPSGVETILYVDDEPSMADLGKRMMGRLGYHVHAFMDPLKALEDFRANPEKFDLVITDMTMPGMTGDRLAEAILKIRRDAPIIMCTGFSKLVDRKKMESMGVKIILDKPLRAREIAVAIRKALD